MPTNQRNTAIRFPDDRNFADFRAFIAQNYRPTEAKVDRDKVERSGATVAVLTTFDFAAIEHGALAAIAFRRHAGVIL
jgi:hypothetical protein